MLDDLLDALDEMKEANNIERLMQRMRERRHEPPRKTPTNLLGYEYGAHSYIRSIAEIGRFLSPAKPIGATTTLRLIRQHGLPARKCSPGGWMVKVVDLLQWAEGFHRRGQVYEERE